MRENRTYGSEGGAAETNRPFLPLSGRRMQWHVLGASCWCMFSRYQRILTPVPPGPATAPPSLTGLSETWTLRI